MATTVKELVATFGLRTDKASFAKGERAVNSIKSAAKTLVTLFAAGAVAQGFRSIMGQASDAAETLNVLGATLGDNAQDVLDWAETTSEEVGRSEFQLREMAGTIGALVQPMIGSRKAAAEMSKGVAQLAVDLGSFFNATDEEALRALRSGLVGQAEPLMRFGVNLQVATLEAFALSRGITKSYKEMSVAEKTNLRYQAILEQTANAQGDAAKTLDGYANSMKALRGGIKDMATRLGGFFLPSAERVLKSLRETVKQWNAWLKANEEVLKLRVEKFLERLGRILNNVASFITKVAQGFSYWFEHLNETQLMLLKIAGAAAALAAVLMLPGGSLMILIGLIALLIDDFETWRAGGKSVIGDLDEALGGFLSAVVDGETTLLDFGTAFEKWKELGVDALKWIGNQIVDSLAWWGNLFKTFIWDIPRVQLAKFADWLGRLFKGIFWDTPVRLLTSLFDWMVKKVKETPIGKIIGGVSGAIGAIAGGGVSDVVAALRGQAPGPAGPVTPRRTAGGVVNQPSSTVQVTVNAAPGMSEELVGDMVAEKVAEQQEAQNRAAIDALVAGAAG